MYAIVPGKGFVGHLLMLNGHVIAEFFCKSTADLVCNLLNVTRSNVRRQAG